MGMTLSQIAEKYGLISDGVDFALAQYQIVISEITHGIMSKLNYYAKDIIQVAQERWCDLKTVSDWISVNDRLPKIGEIVLFTGNNKFGNKFIVQRGLFDGEVWRCDYGHVLDSSTPVTHWMPLPELPKEVNNE